MEEIAAKGAVTLYREKVRFMSGAVVKDNPAAAGPYIIPAPEAKPDVKSSSASIDGEFAKDKK
jgi:hypothetical protein